MIAESLETYAKFNAPWLRAWNDANAASIASVRIAFGQWGLAARTARFMTERVRAYADYDGRLEPLVGRLDRLTEEYGQDYAREISQIYAAWSDLLRRDRALTPSMPLPDAQRRGEEGNGESKRGKRAAERRAEAAH
jgi:hypothetical protein